ncbi:MAG: HAD-IC family P-type ATPase [Actinobacteria bacterium]|nr:HAD-IC family P-type ATPase [Actinomycetota bacterium]
MLLTARRATPIRRDGPLPHPTDQAVAEGTRRAGVRREDGGEFEVLDDVPFEPGRSFHAVLAGTEGHRVLAVKGAPEVVLDRCATWAHPTDGAVGLEDGRRRELEDEYERLAVRGLRVLAIAERPLDQHEVDGHEVGDLRFLGFLGLADPVRPVAADSIRELRRAGVEVIMITGDHPVTARRIAAELGLDGDALLTGPEMDAMGDDELAERLLETRVFARVTPAAKVDIVRALQRDGFTVAMTGDGANDAPAIRLADVGIALGKRATPAAREAADLIITDERLEVIVDAIAEGRSLWSSVRDAVAILLGGNVGEISFMLLGALVGRRPPLNARQVLLVNLLTDVAPAMAIAVRPPVGRTTAALLAQGPEEALGGELDRAIVWRAVGTACGATGAYALARITGTRRRAQTVGLVAVVGAQMGQTIAVAGRDPRVLAAGLGSAAVLGACVQTPGISRLAGSRPMGPVGWTLGLVGATAGATVGVAGPWVERQLQRVGIELPIPEPSFGREPAR